MRACDVGSALQQILDQVLGVACGLEMDARDEASRERAYVGSDSCISRRCFLLSVRNLECA